MNYRQADIDAIKELALKINGYHQETIYNNFFNRLTEAKKKLKKRRKHFEDKFESHPYWAKHAWAYIYPNFLGIEGNNQEATLRTLAENIDYYVKLGIKILYILPHYESPCKDGGYDVSDFLLTRESLGGNEAFDFFMKQCAQNGIKVVIDFIPAHVSEQHLWFQKAMQGEQKYLNYFLYEKHEPPNRLETQGIDSYRVYLREDGSEWYRRLLLLPDSNDRHWIPCTRVNDETIYIHSTFFPHQKDLNLQNPDVLDEFLEILAFWVIKGVEGIRADAIHRWVKLPGSSGEHSPETFAVAEYFSRFLKMLDPEILFLPELVDVPQSVVNYYGPMTEIDGHVTNSISNASINFNKSFEIAWAKVSGDYRSWSNHLRCSEKLYAPKRGAEVVYTGIHHDEIYVGLLGAFFPNEHHVQNMRAQLYKRVKEAGGVTYKEGNSAACTIADFFHGDEQKLCSYYKFMFGHFGSMAIFQGTELGLRNNHRLLYQETIRYVRDLIEAKLLTENKEKVLDEIKQLETILQRETPLPGELSDLPLLTSYFDGRLLHRNPISIYNVENALNNITYKYLSKINKLREKSTALFDGGREEPLSTLRCDIGSFVRRSRNESGKVRDEVAVITNSSPHETHVNISRWELTHKEKFKLIELESEKEFPFTISQDESYITIKMQPNETLWLQIVLLT